MLPPTPQLLVSTATALVAREHHGTARHVDGDRSRAATQSGEASLRFVHFAGFWSHYTQSMGFSSWPLPPATVIEELAKFADRHGGIAPWPLAGDVFLLASVRADRRHVLAGIVSAVEGAKKLLDGSLVFVCDTIEGELAAPRPNRPTPCIANVRLVRRQLSPTFGDRFIRWSDLALDASWAEAMRNAGVVYEMPKQLVVKKRERRREAA